MELTQYAAWLNDVFGLFDTFFLGLHHELAVSYGDVLTPIANFLGAAGHYGVLFIALGVVHQIRYPYYYVKKLSLKCTPEQLKKLEARRAEAEKALGDIPLTGRHRERRIDDFTFINFADLILGNPGDAAFNIAAFFLNFGYLFDAARAAGAPMDGALTTFYHLDPRLPAVFANPAAAVTPAHAEAFAILSDPARGEAAAGFRGEWGEYVCGARRQGRVWLVAGVTVKLRVLTLFFPYLEEGVRYRATWTLDAGADLPTNAVNPTPATVAAGDKAMVRMNPDGGFVLRLEPMG